MLPVATPSLLVQDNLDKVIRVWDPPVPQHLGQLRFALHHTHTLADTTQMMELLKLTVTLMCFAATSATQTEQEQVDLSNVNDFFTSEMVQKRFIVQSVIQVKQALSAFC